MKLNILRFLYSLLLLTGVTLSVPTAAQTAFTSGNLVVYSTLNTGSASTKIVLLQYNAGGSLVSTDTLPYSGAGPYITTSGSIANEGQMTLDSEQMNLIVPGYDTVIGIANISTNTVAKRELFTIFQAGTYSVASIAGQNDAFKGASIYSGTAAGQHYFAVGQSTTAATSGIQLMQDTFSTQISASPDVNRNVVHVYNGKLYYSSESAATPGIYQVGTSGIPYSGSTAGTLLATTNKPVGFALTPNGDTLYVADSSAGIVKFTRSGGTGSFSAGTTIYAGSCAGLTADFSSTPFTIYATTFGAAYEIIKVKDTASYPSSVLATGTEPFRGITFVPGPYAKIKGGGKNICAGNTDTFIFYGNPGDSVTYLVNGTTSYTIAMNSGGTDTLVTTLANLTDNIITYSIALSSIKTSKGIFAMSGTAVDTVSSSIFSTITGKDTLCNTTTTTLSDLTIGGIWSITNSNATLAIIGTNSVVVTGVTPGLDTIHYKINNACGLYERAGYLDILPLVTAGTITGHSTVCNGAYDTLTEGTTGGTWRVTNTTDLLQAANIVKGIGAGIDTVQYIYTNACGTDTASFPITINPLPHAGTITGLQNVCAGSAITLSDTASGGTWSASNGTATISATGRVTGISPGVDTFYYTNTNTCGIAQTSYTVTINGIPDVTGGSSQSVCNNATTLGEEFSSSVTGTSFNWTNSAGTSIGLPGSGSGSILGFTAFNSGTSPVNAIITVAPSTTFCTGASVSYTITVNPTPTANSVSNYSVCNSATVPTKIFTGTVGLTTYSWENADPRMGIGATGTDSIPAYTAINTGATDSVAVITVTPSANGCPGIPISFTVTAEPTPQIGSLSNYTVCNDSSELGIAFSSNVSGSSYTWTNSLSSIGIASSGSGSITATVLHNNSDTVQHAYFTVTPAAASCSGTAGNFTITVNPTPVLVPISNQSVCNGSANTVINFADSVAGASYTWTNNNTETGIPASGTATFGTYTMTNAEATPITSIISYSATANGCPAPAKSFTITVDPTPTVNTVTGFAVCNHTETPIIGFSGSVTPTTFTWTNGTAGMGLGASGTGNIDSFLAVNTGTTIVTAVVTVTPTAFSCPGAATTFTITVDPTPTVNTIGNQSLCTGDTTTSIYFSGAIAGTDYSWTNTNSSIGTTPDGEGNILSFTVADTSTAAISSVFSVTPFYSGCYGTGRTFTITVNATPVLDTISSQILCNNTRSGAINFTSSLSGTKFYWTNSDTAIGLPAIDSGNIAAFTVANDSLIPETSVFTVTPIANSCIGLSQTFSITVDPTPTVDTIANQTICSGDSTTAILFTGNISSANYTWNNHDTSIGLARTGTDSIPVFVAIDTASVASVAIITVTPTAFSCNGASRTFKIKVNPLPVLDTLSGISLCANTNTARITFGSSVTGTTYTWSNSNASIGLAGTGSGANIASFRAIDTSMNTVVSTIFVTPKAAGCVGTTDSFNIAVNPAPNAGTITGSSTVCVNATITLTDSATADSVNWSALNGNASVLNGIVNGLFAGTDTIYYSVTNSCGTDSALHKITVDPLPAVGTITGLNHVCAGSALQLTDTSYIGTIQWTTTGTNIQINQSTGLISTNAQGVDTVQIKASNVCGADSISKVITVYALPYVSKITGEHNYCVGANIILTDSTTGGIWSSGNDTLVTGTSTITGTFTAANAGSTTVKYELGPNENGCFDSSLFTVNVLNSAPFNFSFDTAGIKCPGIRGQIRIHAIGGSGDFNYNWTNGDTTSAIYVYAGGLYSVVVTDLLEQCTKDTAINITEPDSISIIAQIQNDRCNSNAGTINITVSGGTGNYSYSWSNGDSSAALTNLGVAYYYVTITDQNNCKVIDTFTIVDDCGTVLVHNGFTPNGDGVNDQWVIDNIQNYPNSEVKVFDKWGSLVFSKTGYDNTWNADGLPSGTYYYMLKLNGPGTGDNKDLTTGYIFIKR